MSTPFIGQIIMFGGSFAPVNFAKCDGQTLQISQHEALFNLLGTIYGGDGVSTFNLPDLRSRLPIHYGQGPGLSNYSIGQNGGAEEITLTSAQMPAHNHTLNATQTASTDIKISTSVLPGLPVGPNTPNYLYVTAGQTPAPLLHTLAARCVSTTGSSLPHSNMMPSQCITFCIALLGVYPQQ